MSLTFTQPREIDTAELRGATLRQPSIGHQRSFELRGQGLDKHWVDVYGNSFNSFNLKGNNFSSPGVMEHPTAIDQYIAWGLQESKIIERVLRASEVLRARNISTEYIVGLSEPKHFPWPLFGESTSAYEHIQVDEYRRRIVDRYWKSLPEPDRTMDRLIDIQTKFNEMTFYVTMRATDTAFRLGDMITNPTTARPVVYDLINKNGLLPEDEPLQPESQEDWVRYLQKYLAPELAINLARLHEDLAHDFLHRLNITALGGIIDSDSIHGESLKLGDDPVTIAHLANDFYQAALELAKAGPVDLRNKTRLQTVWEFFINYAAETNFITHDFGAARAKVGAIMGAIEPFVQRNDPFGLEVDLVQLLRNEYLELFFDRSEYPDEFANFDILLTEILSESAINIDELAEQLRGVLPDLVSQATDELTNHLTVSDGEFGSQLLEGKYGFDKELRGSIFVGLMVMLKEPWKSHAISEMPNLTAGLSDAALDVAYTAHILRHNEVLEALTDAFNDQIIEVLRNEILEAAQLTRAETVLGDGGVTDYRTTETRPGFLWALSEAVPRQTIDNFAEQQALEFETLALSFNRRMSFAYIEVPDVVGIQEIITNGRIDGIVEGGTNGALRADVVDFPPDEFPYALLVKQDEEGNSHYFMYLADKEHETKLLEIHQDTLF